MWSVAVNVEAEEVGGRATIRALKACIKSLLE